MKLADQLATKRIVAFLGTGGVGKTTIAAASALHAARQGRKTLVLTIDPARRLADALGVKVGAEPVEVRENLYAMMLDTKVALDQLIARYAPNPETMQRVTGSRFYEQLSDAFAGSEEFVAMGALHDLFVDDAFDLVVVDTPPSKHAVDFLNVNRKLIRVFESGAVKYLFKPTRILRLGSGYLATALSRWTSADYLDEVGEFMMTFDGMFLDLEGRVRKMDAVIKDATVTSVNLVTSPEGASVGMARVLFDEVTQEAKLPVNACVVNRFYPRLKGADAAEALGAPGEFRDGGIMNVARTTGQDERAARVFLDDATAAARFYDAVAAAHERGVTRLRDVVAAPLLMVPALAGSVHDLEGLERVRTHLFGA